jgi:hypothetical protein
MRDLAQSILSIVYRRYFELRDKEHIRRVQFRRCSLLLMLWLVLGLFGVKYCYGPQATISVYFPTIALVIWCGVMGSLVNIIVRVINVDLKNSTLVASAESALASGMGSAAVGAVLSCLVYIIFAAGLLRGDVFPNFVSTHPQGTRAVSGNAEVMTYANDLSEQDLERIRQLSRNSDLEVRSKDLDAEMSYVFLLMRDLMPLNGQNFAKLLFWCFLAGYSQGWVLDRLKGFGS